MSVASPRLPPACITWHLSKTEKLPLYFGFNEKKPIPFEQISIHRLSLKRLEQEFFIQRNAEPVRVMEHTPEQHVHPLDDRPIEPVLFVSHFDKPLNVTDDIVIGEAKWSDERKYDTKPEQQPADETPLAVKAEQPAVDEQPILVAAVSKEEPQKEDLPVPVPVPVAEPVDAALKQELHPQVADKEEQLEEERMAAIAKAQGGESVAPLEAVLVAQAEQADKAHEQERETVPVPVAEPLPVVDVVPSEFTSVASSSAPATQHAPHPSLDANFPLEEVAPADIAVQQPTITEPLPQQAPSEQVDASSIADAEGEQAEGGVMTRTQRLAALHENIIKQEALAAQPVAPSSIKRTPVLAPTTASSKIMEIQQQHLAQQAASGETHTVVEKTTSTAQPGRSRIAEMKRLHEQKIKDEAEAKSKQDELFKGGYLKSGGKGGKQESKP